MRLSTDCAFSELLNNLRLRSTWDESRILTSLNFEVIELDKFDREDSKMDDGDFSSPQEYVLFDSLEHSSKIHCVQIQSELNLDFYTDFETSL